MPPERVPSSPLLASNRASVVPALHNHMKKIAEDFKTKGNLFKLWQKDKNATLLLFFVQDRGYNVHETMKLLREILDEVDAPMLLSNSFECTYICDDTPFARDDLYYSIFYALDDCLDICLSIEDVDEFTSIVASRSLLVDKICIYDAMSYLKFVGCKIDLVSWMEKVGQKRISHDNLQVIINLLNKASSDCDLALNVYFVSERATLANVASSLLKNKTEIKEARSTIRFLNLLIGECRTTQQKLPLSETGEKQAEEACGSGLANQPTEISNRLINIRSSDIPDFIETNRLLKLRISKLVERYEGVLVQLRQEKSVEKKEDDVKSNH